MQIAILGRQPKISLAELEALYGAEKVKPIADYAALVDSAEPLPQSRLGGTMKSAKLLTRLEKTELVGAFKYLQESIPEHLQYLPEGKLQFGVSVYGFKAQRDWLLKQMLSLKKVIKKTGQSVRIIENKSEALESAQILYNKLTGPLGWEILLIRDGADMIIAQTTAVQDIDDYAKRDFGRPMRDAFVGMLPPKLAQTMINLANPAEGAVVLDPFCGTGVVLQEALLLNHPVYGSDLSEKMVRYTSDNLNWLQEEYEIPKNWQVEEADATNHTWKQPVDAVVCETYLGQPLSGLPDRQKLDQIMAEANTIAEGFLKNLAPQLKKGTRLCVALPAWHTGQNKFLHLKMLDQLSVLGYNRLEFVHAEKSDLIYRRENQTVARELTILEKK
jgi:tRNA (guanine10-N2)-dimethyltransferase